MRCDGGGAGEFRGGTGIDYVADIETAADYSFRGEGAHGLTAFGVNSGHDGQTGSLKLTSTNGEPIEAPQFGVRRMMPLRVTIASPGGGGFGEPQRRDPEAVLRDVRDGVVSLRAARDVYGVALSGDPLRVDPVETVALRKTLLVV
jgi:N-methylhydantoinase B